MAKKTASETLKAGLKKFEEKQNSGKTQKNSANAAPPESPTQQNSSKTQGNSANAAPPESPTQQNSGKTQGNSANAAPPESPTQQNSGTKDGNAAVDAIFKNNVQVAHERTQPATPATPTPEVAPTQSNDNESEGGGLSLRKFNLWAVALGAGILAVAGGFMFFNNRRKSGQANSKINFGDTAATTLEPQPPQTPQRGPGCTGDPLTCTCKVCFQNREGPGFL